MKTILYLSTVVLLSFNTVVAHAQAYAFRVLANKGLNSVKISSAGQEWQPVKTGVKLNKGDEIMVSANGYVGLVHSSGKTHEIKVAGTYNVNDLVNKISANSSSVASKYANFVLAQMTKEEVDVNKNSRANNKATGAVERGSANDSPILLYSKSQTNVFSPVTVVKWGALKPGEEYIVSVKNIFEENVFTTQTTDTKITLDFNDPKLKNEKLLLVTVVSKADAKMTSMQVGIKRLSEEDGKNISKEFDVLMAENGEETPLNKIIQATFFEQNDLLLDAITNYEAAVKMAPDVEEYKTMYTEFLVRNNLN